MPRTFTNLHYHLVFSTKNRQPWLEESIREDLYGYIGGIVRRRGGVMLAIGGIEDHVHILAGLPPRLALSDVMHKVKGVSSRWLNEPSRCHGRFGWQNGYSAFTVSQSRISKVRQYIEHQEEHHRHRSYQEELQIFLRHHGLDAKRRGSK